VNLPGLLIEYLITGVLAILWIGGVIMLGSDAAPAFDQLSGPQVTLLAPLAYILGMLIDYIGKRLTDPFVIDDSKETLHKAELVARSAEVGKQYEMRKSRDRVARGLLANLVLLGIVGAGVLVQKHPPSLFWWIPLFTLLSILSFIIWRRFYRLTRRYKLKASEAVLRLRDEALPQPKPTPAETRSQPSGIGVVALVVATFLGIRWLCNR
jgi:hypothetical protein